MNRQRVRSAIKAVGWHLSISILVALMAAVLVFVVWYPHPYGRMLGGFELFTLVVGVDVICGPLLTLIVFSAGKSKQELLLDLGIVGFLQLAALVYGMHSVWLARPIYLAYEVDRYRVVALIDINQEDLKNAPPSVHNPSWHEIQMLGVRVAQPADADYLEQMKLSLAGLDVAYRPSRWVPYENVLAQVRKRAKPMEELYTKHPAFKDGIEKAVLKTGLKDNQLRWVPVQSRRSTHWTALISAETADVLGFVHVDSF